MMVEDSIPENGRKVEFLNERGDII